MPDQPTDVRLSAAFAALLQALCATALAGGLPENGLPLADRGRADYSQNRWSAARFGPRARFVHPDGGSYVPAAELGAELLELVRPAAQELGGADLLARLDPAACEADLQLEQESPHAAAADLVARSLRLRTWLRSPRRSRSAAFAARSACLRLAKTLEGTEGLLEAANANLMGQVMLTYDDGRTSRAAIVEAMARGGFREQQFV